MILTLQRLVHTAITDAVHRQFAQVDVPPFTVEVPPNRALGDLAVAVAFQLARPLRKPPRAIAQEIAGAIGPIPGIARIDVAPNGYLNLYLDRAAFLASRVRGEVAPLRIESGKTVVEHTAINPNKAAHIGHLRNAALGDTLARVLRFRDTPVEVQNYIDDTGVQVADVIVGFRELEHLTLADVRHLAETTRFDYYCWDLYSRVTEWYEGDKERLAIRAAALHDLERGSGEVADMGALIVDHIVRAHLKTMARLNVSYDLLTYEGDILRLHFWSHAFDILKAQGSVFLKTEGRLAGCWVMRIEEGETGGDEAVADPAGDGDETAAGEEKETAREKVIVRSNGVVTYVGKDIANQFWKLGLLGRDFRYRRFLTQTTGQVLWATTSGEGEPGAPAVRSRRAHLQRDRFAPDVLAGAAQPGPSSARSSARSRQLDSLFLRDGGALAPDGARAGLRHRRGRPGAPAVCGGVGPQGSRREDRRPARPADRQGVVGGATPQSGVFGRRMPAGGRPDRGRRDPLLHAEVLARQADRVRYRGSAQL